MVVTAKNDRYKTVLPTAQPINSNFSAMFNMNVLGYNLIALASTLGSNLCRVGTFELVYF